MRSLESRRRSGGRSRRRDDLGAGEALLEAVEAVGVDGDVAVDERVLELVGRGLDLERGLCRLLIVDVGAGLDDERVDVGVAAEDDERLGLLVDGAGRLAVGGVDGAELDAGEGRLLVVGVGVALDFLERARSRIGLLMMNVSTTPACRSRSRSRTARLGARAPAAASASCASIRPRVSASWASSRSDRSRSVL
jgi:hypothetical protein